MHKLATDTATHELFYRQLGQEIQTAKQVVYELDKATPLESLQIGKRLIHAKREDCSRIHSYKWRGAYFKMHQLVQQGFEGSIVAASAGNHAQGVAIAAQKLKTPATIFMPRTTPELKQQAVKDFGGEFVSVELVGDCFDEAATAATKFLETNPGTMLQPFDDLSVIAGQATVGLELIEQCPELTKIYVPIGGGGLASGVAFAIKNFLNLNCKIVGVEVDNQNSMQLSRNCGHRITMEQVDTFCDGTAVRQPGQYTFAICTEFLDEIITVSNEEVTTAMRKVWDSARFVPEPSGGIAMAGAIKNLERDADDTVAAIVSGSNMDFRTLPRVVRMSMPAQNRRRYFRFNIDEQNGSLIQLLDKFMNDLNIVDFQYGKTDSKLAQPVLGIEGPESQLDNLAASTNNSAAEISGESLSEFRVIPFRPDLCEQPLFLKVDFPNRPGALRDLMRQISGSTNICYFNFVDSGELEGHALIGFELIHDDSEYQIRKAMFELGLKFQTADSR